AAVKAGRCARGTRSPASCKSPRKRDSVYYVDGWLEKRRPGSAMYRSWSGDEAIHLAFVFVESFVKPKLSYRTLIHAAKTWRGVGRR
ncbi:unnamed protein product, partial [Ectocarpus sp. 13 AM-2016]